MANKKRSQILSRSVSNKVEKWLLDFFQNFFKFYWRRVESKFIQLSFEFPAGYKLNPFSFKS